jgi:hypothetical protein
MILRHGIGCLFGPNLIPRMHGTIVKFFTSIPVHNEKHKQNLRQVFAIA